MRYGAQYVLHAGLALTGGLIVGAIFYVLRIVLYQNLSHEDYGLFYAILSASLMLHPILAFGFDPGLVPYFTKLREENRWPAMKYLAFAVARTQMAIALPIVIGVWIAAPALADTAFGDPAAAIIIRLVAIHAIALLAFKLGFSLLLGLQQIAARTAGECTRALVCLATAAILLDRGLGVQAAALAYVAGTTAGTAFEYSAIWFAMPALRRARAQYEPGLVALVFRSGRYLSIAFGGVLIFAQMDTVMLTILGRDLLDVAAYQVAAPTIMIIYGILFAGATNFMPMVATLWHRGQQHVLSEGLGILYRAAFVLFLPATALAACFSDIIMATLFRRDILNAPHAFNVLAWGSVAYFIAFLNLHVLAGIGHARAAARSVLVALAANLLLNAALIPPFGVRGAAIATVSSHVIAALLSIAAVRSTLRTPFPLGPCIGSATVAIAVFAAGYGLRQTEWFARAPLLFAGLAIPTLYALALVLLELAGIARLRQTISIIVKGRVRAA